MGTLYFSPSGSDTTGNGTEANPYLKVTKCITEATSGDTLVAMAGTHTLDASFNLATKNLTLLGETGTLTNGKIQTATLDFNGGGWTIDYGSGLIQDLIMTGNVNASYTFLAGATGVSGHIKRVFFDNMETGSNRGLMSGGANAFGLNPAASLTLTSCVFWNCHLQSAGSVQSGIVESFGVPTYYYNNTFYNDTHTDRCMGIASDNGSTFVMKNNIFWNNSGASQYAFKHGGTLTPTTADKNFFSGWSSSITGIGTSGVNYFTLASTPIGGDPLFVDASVGDFTLQAGSPYVGQGTL